MKRISLIIILSILLFFYSCSLIKFKSTNVELTEVCNNDTTFLFDTTLYNGNYKFYIQSLKIHENSLITKIDKNGDTYMVDTVNRTYFTADTLLLKEIQKLFIIAPPKTITFAGHNYMIRIYKDNTIFNDFLINSGQNYISNKGQIYYFNGRIMDIIAPKITEQDSIRLSNLHIY